MRGRRRRARRTAAWAVIATLVLSACAQVVTLDPPDIDAVEKRPPAQSFVYDDAGNRLAVLRKEFRERVDLEQVPDVIEEAVVAAEDQRFWHHTGVDARAIARAGLRNVAEGETEEGGSTITQQLVKNLYMPDAPRTFETKFHEALLARDLERKLTKEQILADYLNTVYFGNGAYGIQAAAFTYFRKDVSEVTLPEAALLAGLIRSPATLTPTSAPDAARERRDRVLERMHEEGFLDAEGLEEALAVDTDVQPRPASPATAEPHWVDFVVRTLLGTEGLGTDQTERAEMIYGGGLRIHTTLDPETQAQAQAAVERFFPDPDDDPGVALAVVDPENGRILATARNRPHDVLQFDLATQAQRQPGSTFKTFTLVSALADGWRPDSRISGNQATFVLPDGTRWPVRNYSGVSYGTIDLAEATRASVNAAYARLVLEVGVSKTIAAARAMGIESPINTDPPITLGGLERCCTPLEMAAAYATLANMGMRVPASPIDRVEDAEGNVVWRPNRVPRRALDPGIAWVTTQLLRNVVEDGTGVHAQIGGGWEVAGKTGTVQDYTDAWFVGYTPTLAASVWIGWPQGRVELRNIGGERVVTGGSWPARIWREFMAAALADQRPTGFVLDDQYLVELEIDPQTGLLAAPWCPGEVEVMPRILAPDETCPSPPPPPPPAPSPTSSPTPTACPSGPAAGPTPREPDCPPAGSEEPQTETSPSPSPEPSPPSPGPGATPGDG